MTQHDELIRLGMRNEIIHGYSTVDLEILLRTVEQRLPRLIEQLETALGKDRT